MKLRKHYIAHIYLGISFAKTTINDKFDIAFTPNINYLRYSGYNWVEKCYFLELTLFYLWKGNKVIVITRTFPRDISAVNNLVVVQSVGNHL